MKTAGFTLLEMLLVVAILGIIALVALPDLTQQRSEKLELAANLVANAVRYAQQEAIRTGEVHGVSISQVTQEVEVSKYDTTTSPVSEIVTLTNPMNKQQYLIDFDRLASTQGVTIANSGDIFEYEGSLERRTLLFDTNGTPIWVMSAGTDTYLLKSAQIILQFGDETHTVVVEKYSGRVTY